MSQNEESIRNEPNINVISELPTPPFKLTMEVPLFLIMVAISLSGTVNANIILLRTCLHSLHYSDEQCNALFSPIEKSNETKLIEEEVQKYATSVNMVRSVLEAIFPAILSLFLGVWSDTYGRKPLVVWPLFGLSMTSMSMVVYSLWKSLGPWWYVLTAVPLSLSGGLVALFTGAFSYMTDITSTESRSFRLSVLEGAILVGTVVGSLMSSYLVNMIGNTLVLLLHAVIIVAAYAFTNIFVAESLRGALRGSLSTVMDLLLMKEMLDTCFKSRPNKLRSIILLLIFANGFSIFILYGVLNVEYIYTRDKFEWDLKTFNIFVATNIVITISGLLIGVTIMQKVCRISDMLLVHVSYLSLTAESIIKAFAMNTWHMYLGSSVSMFKGLGSPLVRSFLTKILPLEDIAKVFALACTIEAILPVLSPIIYNTLYISTISTFPGAFFLLSAALYMGCMVMLGIAQYYYSYYSATPYTSISRTEST